MLKSFLFSPLIFVVCFNSYGDTFLTGGPCLPNEFSKSIDFNANLSVSLKNEIMCSPNYEFDNCRAFAVEYRPVINCFSGQKYIHNKGFVTYTNSGVQSSVNLAAEFLTKNGFNKFSSKKEFILYDQYGNKLIETPAHSYYVNAGTTYPLDKLHVLSVPLKFYCDSTILFSFNKTEDVTLLDLDINKFNTLFEIESPCGKKLLIIDR